LNWNLTKNFDWNYLMMLTTRIDWTKNLMTRKRNGLMMKKNLNWTIGLMKKSLIASCLMKNLTENLMTNY